MTRKAKAKFDFSAFKVAVEQKDPAAWAGFFADDAEWIEYRNQDPPDRPRCRRGREEIDAYVRHLSVSSPTRIIENEVISDKRIAYRCWTALTGGQRVVEHIILEISRGKIRQEVDVEAWDLMPPRNET